MRCHHVVPLFAIVLAVSSTGTAQTVVTDDAHVNTLPKNREHEERREREATDANYGIHPNLALSPGSPVFLKFDVTSGLPPSTPGTAVAKATLRLYLGNVRVPGSLEVNAVAGDWNERTITGINAPPFGALLGITEPIAADSRHHFLMVDVTSIVTQWLGDDGLGTNGLPNDGIALAAHGATTVTFDSKENSQTSHEPQLLIELRNPAGTSGISTVNANFPLSVADSTTTPTISLGLVPVANGGTGLSSAGDAGNFLRSAGGIWTAAPLTAVDVPDLAGSYIKNATVPQTAANFNIAGIGTAGVLDATTQFNLGGSRILTNAGTNNLFAGIDAGATNTTGNANAFFGKNAGRANTAGISNSFVGYNAGAGNSTGARNAFFGDAAGFVNAAANDNAFFGFLAGFHNTASNNAFFGSLAGADNTTGQSNSFFGYNAGVHNTSGSGNAFFGLLAGRNNETGEGNSYFGSLAGVNARGSENSFVGGVAGFATTTGSENTFVGSFAGHDNTTGWSNAFFGRSSGLSTTTGSGNTFLGAVTGFKNKTGSNNTLAGANADVASDGLSFATAIGSGARVETSNTIVLGRSADTVRVPGALNVAGTFGADILSATTQFNLAGNRLLSVSGSPDVPNSNLFAGVGAGASNPSGIGNSFFGLNAGASTTLGGRNAFFGAAAGFSNTTGESNAFFGNLAGFSNTGGESNTFFGPGAGLSNTTGSGNAFFGNGAGVFTTTGLSNTFVGSRAGTHNSTGSSNTIIGASANLANNLSFASAIGAGALVTESNALVLGSIAGVNNSTASTSVGIGTTAPQARLDVRNGNILIGSPGQGIILKSPDGAACRLLSIDNAGNLSLVAVGCP